MPVSDQFKAIAQEHRGIKYRSRTEARWSEFFHLANVDFHYEPEGIDLGGDFYVPDFYLPFAKIYFEVKPFTPNPREIRVARALASATHCVVVIACGNPNIDVSLIAYDDRGRTAEVEFSNDNASRSPWLGMPQREGHVWQVALSPDCDSRGYGRDADLDRAGKLQFNAPDVSGHHPYDWRHRERLRLPHAGERRVVSGDHTDRRVLVSRELERRVLAKG